MKLNIEELKRSEVSAAYLGQQMAWDLEKRMPFRRTMKKYLEQILQNRDVKGAKIMMAGRLGRCRNRAARTAFKRLNSSPDPAR